ncbi:3-deoxy-D-manno-octulosonate 8-phosphate phosphatase, YrbI family (modular protein) [Candidatus Zixiibacteriota bacterium]|nr:3-deoxy-D-manno-octulosonate 8-phosphate phosphatase, YrbI family (modular protein) [candidate division Zixibacteria bacterium]
MPLKKKHLTGKELARRFKAIKLLALDVDGVLTDDHIYFGPDGFEMKQFNISDGFFMVLARRAGLEIVIVSGRPSQATTTRMKDLGIKYILQEMKDKRKQLLPLLDRLKIDPSQVAFVGNEILDIGLAREVGLSVAVADACDELKEMVDYVTRAKGGRGAVREVIRAYFDGNNLDPASYLI